MLGIDDLRCILPTPADHPQGVTRVRSDICQFFILQTYFYPTASGTDATNALLPYLAYDLLFSLALILPVLFVFRTFLILSLIKLMFTLSVTLSMHVKRTRVFA